MTRSEAVTHFRGEQKYYSAFMQPKLAEACKLAADALEAVERLEAGIQVRDNMGNEVLRILREATGRRDFHSEMEAADLTEYLLAEVQRRKKALEVLFAMANAHRHEAHIRRSVEEVMDLLGGWEMISKYDEILGTVAENATVAADPREEALRVAKMLADARLAHGVKEEEL